MLAAGCDLEQDVVPFFHERIAELDPPLGEPRRAMAFRGGCALFRRPAKQTGGRPARREAWRRPQPSFRSRTRFWPSAVARYRKERGGRSPPTTKNPARPGGPPGWYFPTPLAVAAHRAAAGAPPVERARARSQAWALGRASTACQITAYLGGRAQANLVAGDRGRPTPRATETCGGLRRPARRGWICAARKPGGMNDGSRLTGRSR